jgi:hypothetical protein
MKTNTRIMMVNATIEVVIIMARLDLSGYKYIAQRRFTA